MSETAEIEHAQPRYGRIFWALLILTILELFVANLHLAKQLTILTLVFLAVVKASLVALFYMHLKFEKILLYFIIGVPLVLSFILTLLTMTDAIPLAR